MNGEWEVKRVADLLIGDEVRDYDDFGAVTSTRVCENGRRIVVMGDRSWAWPAHARVDVRRPVDVRVERSSDKYDRWYPLVVRIDGMAVAQFRSAHAADEYATVLRASADARETALEEAP